MRTRLLLALVGVVALVLLVHDVPLAAHLETVERDRLVTRLERDAFIVGGRAEEALEDDAAAGNNTLRLLVTRYAEQEDVRVVVVDRDGTGVVASDDDGLDEDFSNRPEIDEVLAFGDPRTGQRFSNTLGEDLFYVAVPVLSGDDVVGAVRITAPEQVVSERVSGRVRGLVVVALISLLIAVGVAWLVASSLARPLLRLRLATDKFASGDLSTRADEGDGPGEVRALAHSFNSMAGRLSGLIDRQREFAGTASHQLRTPLTALRLRLEQLHGRVATDVVAERMVDDALHETDRLHRMVEGLLALSRADGSSAVAVEVDLSAIVGERSAHWSPLADERGVTLRSAVPAGMCAVAIDGAVEQILDNFIDNALDVSPAGGELLVSAFSHGSWIELHVVDQGPGLPDEERERAFERFWRGADATPDGTGLGLAIVHQLAAASGGEAELRQATGGGIDAVVRLRAA
jgi:signal transduction histidine kinase